MRLIVIDRISHVWHGLELEPSTNEQDTPRFQAVFG